MKKILTGLTSIIIIALLLSRVNWTPKVNKYTIENDSNIPITERDYEQLHERATNAAFANIDIIEDEYLGAEEGHLRVYPDNSAIMIVKTVEKPDVKDNSVMVTFTYNKAEKKWRREQIIYNGVEYGKKE